MAKPKRRRYATKDALRTGFKACIKCGETKPISEFEWRESSRVFESRCRSCRRANTKAFYNTPRGKQLRYEQVKRPKTRFAQLRCDTKRRNITLELTIEEYSALVENARCSYCDTLIETGTGLDRLDSSGGYTKHNVIPCCAICNAIRSDIFTVSQMKQFGALVRLWRESGELQLPLRYIRGKFLEE